MSTGEYSDLETVSGMLSFFGVGLAAGFMVDAVAPAPAPTDSIAQLLLQSGVQSAASLAVLTQLMRMVLPRRDNWLPPCTDASALVGVFLAQPRLRAALEMSLAKLDAAARAQLGLISGDAAAQPAIAPPTTPAAAANAEESA
jgi:hypothetical protein